MADLFDVLDLMLADEHSAGSAPRHFHTSTRWSLEEVLNAYELELKRADLDEGTLGISRRSHMWHVIWRSTPRGAHPIEVICADLRCDHHGAGCECIGSLVYRAWCGQCRTWSAVHDSERRAVEEMHDHCWPGWRTLPLGADTDRPEHWTQPGAPILTPRTQHATRPVQSRSPYGGYDLPDPAAA
ncbi:hypothetical protein GCM10028787_31550 [Brachybacterium horti]